MNRSRRANDLVRQLCYEKEVDILAISEQYTNVNRTNWYTDNLGTSSIWVININKIPVKTYGSEDGYVWLTSEAFTLFSCYFTPNESITDF